MTPPRTRNPDEESVRHAVPDLRIPSIHKVWRSHARVHHEAQPLESALMPPGLASALTAPVVTQCLILAHMQGTDAAPPVIGQAHVTEERLLPAQPHHELLIHVARKHSGMWSAECVQDDSVVARVTWEWVEAPRPQ